MWDLKLLYFVIGVRDTMIGRFFVIFLLDQNLSAYQIGIISGACCLIIFIASPFWSFLADYFNNRYMVLQLVLILSGLLSLLLLFPHYILRINDSDVLFPMLGTLVVIYNFPNLVHSPLMDTLCILKLGENPHKYGKQRAGASFGWAIAHIILGVALDFGLNIKFIIVFFFILTIPSCIVVYHSFHGMKLKDTKKNTEFMSITQSIELMIPTENAFETNDNDDDDPDIDDIDKELIKKSEIDSNNDQKVSALETLKLIIQSRTSIGIFLVIFAWGGMLSCVESLLYVYIEELDGDVSYTYLGLAVGATIPSEMILLYTSDWFIYNIGYRNMIHIGLFAYICRVIGYTFITSNNLWLLLFTEPLHGFIFGFVHVSTTQLVNEIFPTKYAASAQGLKFAFQLGFGPFIFVVLGGIALDSIGGKLMYTILAIVAFMVIIMFHYVSRGNPIFEAKKKSNKSEKDMTYDRIDISTEYSTDGKRCTELVQSTELAELKH